MASVLGMQVTVLDARNEILPFVDRAIAAGLHQHLRSRGGTMEFLRDTVFNFPTMAEAYKAAADDGLSRV